jgi:acetyl esterase/lipase
MLHLVRAASFAGLTAVLLSGCAAPPQGVTPNQPTADMAAVLTAQAGLGAKPIEDLTPAQARMNPSIADAVLKVEQQRGMSTEPMPARVEDIQVQGAGGLLPARVYRPAAATPGPLPIVLYFHGGGWVIATIDTYDSSARALADGAGAIVVSVEYRKGPEDRFPSAHDDAIAAYRFVLEHAAPLGGDERHVAVAGESAGGNLAFNVALAARDQKLPMPVHELLVYPVAGTDLTAPSVQENARAKPLSRAALEWFIKYYGRGPQDTTDTRLNLLGVSDLQGLPPTTIILAQIDPLRSGGEMLGDRLRTAGVPTETRLYPGVTHEFFGTGAVVPDGKAAVEFASERLRQSFAAVPPMPAPTRRGRARANTMWGL